MAIKTWNASSLTGGALRALDSFNVASLTDGDRAFVVYNGVIYYYEFDAAATTAESSPSFIRPNDYATSGVWVLSRWYTQETSYNGNLLINSNFPVNQEAYTSSGAIPTGQYGHDMWKSISSARYTVSGGALTMVSGTLGQSNEDISAENGSAVTISIVSGSLTIGATAGAAARTITPGNPYSWTLNTSGSAFVTITAATAAYGIKLERGSTATGWEKPEPRAEEQRCFRYLRYLKSSGGSLWNLTYLGVADGTSSNIWIPLSPRMSTISAVTISTPLQLYLVVPGEIFDSSQAIASISSFEQNSDGVALELAHPSADVSGLVGVSTRSSAGAGYIKIDARP